VPELEDPGRIRAFREPTRGLHRAGREAASARDKHLRMLTTRDGQACLMAVPGGGSEARMFTELSPPIREFRFRSCPKGVSPRLHEE
jgi:hypothetical protein